MSQVDTENINTLQHPLDCIPQKDEKPIVSFDMQEIDEDINEIQDGSKASNQVESDQSCCGSQHSDIDQIDEHTIRREDATNSDGDHEQANNTSNIESEPNESHTVKTDGSIECISEMNAEIEGRGLQHEASEALQTDCSKQSDTDVLTKSAQDGNRNPPEYQEPMEPIQHDSNPSSVMMDDQIPPLLKSTPQSNNAVGVHQDDISEEQLEVQLDESEHVQGATNLPPQPQSMPQKRKKPSRPNLRFCPPPLTAVVPKNPSYKSRDNTSSFQQPSVGNEPDDNDDASSEPPSSPAKRLRSSGKAHHVELDDTSIYDLDDDEELIQAQLKRAKQQNYGHINESSSSLRASFQQPQSSVRDYHGGHSTFSSSYWGDDSSLSKMIPKLIAKVEFLQDTIDTLLQLYQKQIIHAHVKKSMQ